MTRIYISLSSGADLETVLRELAGHDLRTPAPILYPGIAPCAEALTVERELDALSSSHVLIVDCTKATWSTAVVLGCAKAHSVEVHAVVRMSHPTDPWLASHVRYSYASIEDAIAAVKKLYPRQDLFRGDGYLDETHLANRSAS